MSPSSPPELDGFEVASELTAADTVSAYAAKQISMDRMVTLFVLEERLGADPAGRDEFLTRVRTVAQAGLRCAPAVINVGAQGNWHYVLADHVPGRTLAEAVKSDGPMPQSQALSLIQGIASALDECAKKNIVHGGLMASDGVWREDGSVRVLRVGLLATVRNHSDLQVHVRRDMYALGEVLRVLMSGGEVSEFGFADEAPAEGSGGDDVAAFIARLQGSGAEPFSDYQEVLAWVAQVHGGPDGTAAAPDEPGPLFALDDGEAPIETAVRLESDEDRSELEQIYADALVALDLFNFKEAVRIMETLPRNYRDVGMRLDDAKGKLKLWYHHIDAGKAMWEKGDAKAAIENWTAALVIRPKNQPLKQKIAQAKAMAGQEIMVHDYIEEAKRHCDGGDFPAARLACQQALKINPKHEAALSLLTEIDLRQLQGDIKAYCEEAEGLFEQKQYGPAIGTWQRAVSMSMDDKRLKRRLAPRIAEAKRRQRTFRVMVTLGVVLFLVLLGVAVAVTLSG